MPSRIVQTEVPCRKHRKRSHIVGRSTKLTIYKTSKYNRSNMQSEHPSGYRHENNRRRAAYFSTRHHAKTSVRTENLYRRRVLTPFRRSSPCRQARAAEPSPSSNNYTTWVAHTYRDVSALMIAIGTKARPCTTRCVAIRTASSPCSRTRAAGAAKPDMDGTDLFALVGALSWLGDQPVAERGHLFEIVAGSILIPSSI